MRVAFVVDGFNLYHSLKTAQKRVGTGLRWLDLHALCSTILSSSFGPGYTLEGVYYFSAFAKHLENEKPDVVRRHRTYKEALEVTGVETSFASFKRKERNVGLNEVKLSLRPFRKRLKLNLPRVRLEYRTHEEKETDVALACKVLELLHRQKADVVVIVTGDTDIAPAIRTALSLFPSCEIGIAFPFNRYNEGLAKLVKRRIKLDAAAYAKHQLPPEVVAKNSRRIRKPTHW